MPIEQSRAEYLQALLQQRNQLNANNNNLLNPSVSNDIEQQATMNTNMQQKQSVSDIEQPKEADTSSDNWFTNIINKANGFIQNMANAFLTGVGGAFEGVIDLGANIVAAIGDSTGWYDTSGITDFIKHDYAKDFADFNTDVLGVGMSSIINLIKSGVTSGGQNIVDAFTDISSYKDKYANELYGIEGLKANRNVDSEAEEFAMGISQSIGFMLPSIVLGGYGGQVASLTSMGVSAAGKGGEEALQEGASSGQALGYGALSGAAEVLSEVVVGKALKVAGLGTGKVFGLVGKKGLEKTAAVGTKAFIKELAQNFIEEGLEEVSTAVLEPLFKATYKGSSEFDKYKSSDFWFGTNGHFNESVLGQFTSGGITAGITGGAVKIVNKVAVTKKVGANGYKVAQVYQEMMENDADLLKQKKGSKAYNEVANNGAKLQSQYIEAMDKFMQNSTDSQKQEMAKMLGNPNEYAKFITTENANINEDVKNYLTDLSKINADTNKRIAKNFMNQMQDRYGTDYKIEFDEVKDADGNEQYAYVDSKNKVIRINDKMVAEKGGSLLAHEYFGHVLGQNLSAGTRTIFYNQITQDNWYKEIFDTTEDGIQFTREDRLIENYVLDEDEKFNKLKSNKEKKAYIDKVKEKFRGNAHYQDEVIAYYLQDVFGDESLDKQLKHLKAVFSQPNLLERILSVFNKSRKEFKTPNIIKEYAKTINKTIDVLYGINKNNTLLKALYKEKNNYKLTENENKLKSEYNNLFDLVRENKSQPQLAYSKILENLSDFQKQPFEKQIDDFTSGNIKSNEILVVMKKIPNILKRNGAKGAYISLNQGDIRKKLKYHPEMTPELIKQLPEHIEKPLFVIRGSVDNSLVEIVSLKSSNGEILVSFDLTEKQKDVELTRISSFYSKRDLDNYLIRQANDNKIIDVYDKEKTNQWLNDRGLQLPKSNITDLLSTNNIASDDKNVNFSKNLDSDGNKLSENQEKFFKDSKVRDEKGNLLVVYHGTQSDFNVYDKSKLGKMTSSDDAKLGFHLTDNKDLADIFSKLYSDELIYKISDEVTAELGYDDVDEIERRLKTFAKENGKIKEQYINMVKPLDITPTANLTSDYDIGYAINYALNNTKKLVKSDYIESFEDIANILRSNFDNEIAMIKDELVNTDGAIDRLKELGYDGLILPLSQTDLVTLENEDKSVLGREYVVFESNQIKNIDNYNPTENPDIRYSKKLKNNNNKSNKPAPTYKSMQTTRDILEITKNTIENNKYHLVYPKSYYNFTNKTFTEINSRVKVENQVNKMVDLLKTTTLEQFNEETQSYEEIGTLGDIYTDEEIDDLKQALKTIIETSKNTTAKSRETLPFEKQLNKMTDKANEYGARIGRVRVLNNKLNSIDNKLLKFTEVTEDNIARNGLNTLLEPFTKLKGTDKGYSSILKADRTELRNAINKTLEWYNPQNIQENFETLPYDEEIRSSLEELYEMLGKAVEKTDANGKVIKYGANLSTDEVNKIIDTMNLIEQTISNNTRASIENKTYANATAKVMMNKKEIRGLAKVIKMWKRGFAPAYTLIREMLGGNSPLARLLTTDITNATSNNTMYKGMYFDKLKTEMKKLGIKQRELNKRITVKGVELTMDQALYLYISLNTDTNYNEIDKNGFEYVDKDKKSKTFGVGEAAQYKAELEKVLPENIRKMGDYLQTFMNTEMKADYIKWYESRYGKFAGRNEIGRIGDKNYWMLNRSYQYATSAEKVIKTPVGVFKRSITRTGNNNAILLGGALSSVTTYIEQLGNEIYMKPIYRQAYQILNTKVNGTTIYKMLLEADTKDVKYLETTLNDVVGVNNFKNNDMLSKMMSTFSVAKLSLNIGSMMKQYASIYTSNIPLRKSIKGKLRKIFSKQARAEFKTLVDEIGSLKYREGVNPVLEANAGKIGGITETIANVGMWGIRKMDYFTIGVGVYSLMQIGQDQFGYKIGTQENIDFVKEHWNEFEVSQISNNPLSKNAISRGDLGQVTRLVFGFLQGANRAAFGSQITKIGLWKRNHNVDKTSIQNNIKDLKTQIKDIENANLDANNKFDSLNLDEDTRAKYITLQSDLMQNEDALKDYEAYEISGGKMIPVHMVSGLIAQGIFVAFINELMKHIKGKKDWDEWDIAEFGLDVTLATAVDWLPFVNVISSMVKGYDVQIPAVEIMNEAVDIIGNAKNGNWQSMIRQLALLIGDTTGIPFQTLYQYMYGTIKSFNPEIAYQMNNVLYGNSSQSAYNTLNRYVERNNVNGVKSMINILMSDYKVASVENVNNELSRLYMNGYNNTIPKSYMTYYTDDKGETIELTTKQIADFRSYYNEATKSVNELINITDYKNLTDEDKSKIIKKIYDAYYSMAKAKTLKIKADSRLGNYLLYTNQNANIGKISLVLGSISNIAESKTKTRKELVFDYVNRLKGYSKAEKLLILYFAGYTSSANEPTLRGYLMKNGMTINQIKEFLG